jgi:hypothetical protein
MLSLDILYLSLSELSLNSLAESELLFQNNCVQNNLAVKSDTFVTSQGMTLRANIFHSHPVMQKWAKIYCL